MAAQHRVLPLDGENGIALACARLHPIRSPPEREHPSPVSDGDVHSPDRLGVNRPYSNRIRYVCPPVLIIEGGHALRG